MELSNVANQTGFAMSNLVTLALAFMATVLTVVLSPKRGK